MHCLARILQTMAEKPWYKQPDTMILIEPIAYEKGDLHKSGGSTIIRSGRTMPSLLFQRVTWLTPG